MKLRGMLSILEAIVIATLFIAATGTFAYTQSPQSPTPAPATIPTTPDDGTKKSLQLETFYISPNPTIVAINQEAITKTGQASGWNPVEGTKNFEWTGTTCEPDTTKSSTCTCAPNQETDVFCPSDTNCSANGGYSSKGACIYDDPSSTGYQDNLNNTSCNIQCNSKPIIYLYPEKPTLVNVRLEIPGVVTESDPLYPVEGWQNILAFPDGKLIYQNKNYHELYYETATIKAKSPEKGYYIARSELLPRLTEYTTKLGLNSFEQKEFLGYWVPRLEALHAPYIFFSVYSNTEKERVDHVAITPSPDTTIAFLAYFKSVNIPGTAEPLPFPVTPRRHGFTMVEWGGTIDRQ
jgi:hypothetical protein